MLPFHPCHSEFWRMGGSNRRQHRPVRQEEAKLNNPRTESREADVQVNGLDLLVFFAIDGSWRAIRKTRLHRTPSTSTTLTWRWSCGSVAAPSRAARRDLGAATRFLKIRTFSLQLTTTFRKLQRARYLWDIRPSQSSSRAMQPTP